MRPREDAAKRFEDKYTPEALTGCWLWTAHVDQDGYGDFWFDGKMRRATRFIYEQTRGQIPGGLHLDHKCRNRSCVNPDHLEAVTCLENTRRGARGVLRTHCARGHELVEGNIYMVGRERRCRRCSLDASRRYQDRLKHDQL